VNFALQSLQKIREELNINFDEINVYGPGDRAELFRTGEWAIELFLESQRHLIYLIVEDLADCEATPEIQRKIRNRIRQSLLEIRS